MAEKYNFQYLPLTGRLSGNEMLDQTERAINELGDFVIERSVDPSYIEGVAAEANENSLEALERATEALETSGRVYVTETDAVDVDTLFDSELVYIANTGSTHIPETSTGFLTVLTNYVKSAVAQYFLSDVTGKLYVRYGILTGSMVGDTTVYTPTWEEWESHFVKKAEMDSTVEAINERIVELESYPHFEYTDGELYLVY